MTTPTVGLIAEQLLQSPPGGIGTYVRGLLRALPGQGIRVRPVVARHRADDLERAGLDDADPIMLSLPRQALYESWSRFGRPRAPAGLDLIHATSLAVPFADPRPLVVTVHDLFFRTYADATTARGTAFHERGLAHLDRARIVLCPSEATASELRALDPAPTDVRVTPLATDLRPPRASDVAAARAALRIERPYVLCLATREPRKNLEGAVRAFARARRRIDPAIVLVLAGPPGWGDDRVAAAVRDEGIVDRIREVGFVPEEHKAGLLAGAAVFLFPSLAEGFGFPALEAMAVGTPVVTTDGSSLPELVGDAALTADPTDIGAVAEALAWALTDETLAADLAQRGLARAAAFTWERTAELTAAAYRDAVRS
jgi:glycosyltransferase involved in cell wall biosynthesis